MRKLQEKFTLEPAGSHGVWGLDDYHFLPFLLGGAELIHHPVVKVPGDIHKLDLLEDYHHDFMYLDCIKVIREVKKTAAFSETSPMLNDISHAASWEKIAMVSFLSLTSTGNDKNVPGRSPAKSCCRQTLLVRVPFQIP